MGLGLYGFDNGSHKPFEMFRAPDMMNKFDSLRLVVTLATSCWTQGHPLTTQRCSLGRSQDHAHHIYSGWMGCPARVLPHVTRVTVAQQTTPHRLNKPKHAVFAGEMIAEITRLICRI
jgi:hypothetical protein